eukprot:Gb_25514 [translate_table: standard]
MRINLTNKVQKRLNLGLKSGPEVLKEVENDAHANKSILFVVCSQNIHCNLEQVLYKWPENLAVREPGQNLYDNISHLVFETVRCLRLRQLCENGRKYSEVTLQKVQIF